MIQYLIQTICGVAQAKPFKNLSGSESLIGLMDLCWYTGMRNIHYSMKDYFLYHKYKTYDNHENIFWQDVNSQIVGGKSIWVELASAFLKDIADVMYFERIL